MPLDDRVRRGLERSAEALPVDTLDSLEAVRRKRRAATNGARLADGLVVVVVLLVGIAIAPGLLNQAASPIPSLSSSPQASPTASAQSTIVGSFAVDLSAAGEPLKSSGLDGEWQISFESDGTMTWSAPRGRISMPRPLDTYQASAGRLTTNLFTQSLCRGAAAGSYTWARTGTTLVITVVEDGCVQRRAILTTSAWTSQ